MGRTLLTVARLGFGGIFFVFGLNGFFHFLPMTPPPAEATAFTAAYFFPFVKAVETVCGAALLANRYVPLATVVLAPVVINILVFHVFLDPVNLPFAVVLVGLNVALAVGYRGAFAGLLVARALPNGGR